MVNKEQKEQEQKEQEQVKKQRKLKSFTDVFGDGEFYPDLPKIDFKELMNKQLVLEDAKILKDFNGEFGKHDAALMMFTTLDTDDKFTSICSGQVVVERIERCIKQRAMPLLATPIKVESDRNSYYNIK